jgi:NodT family efflux transporter outer membrane factor (OMF) lipoprotein
MQSMKFIILFLLVTVISGCAVIEPGPPTLAPLQGEQLGLKGAGVPWPTEKWWHRYRDRQLNELIDEALDANPSLAAARTRLASANASVAAARAVRLPQLNAGYQLTRERYSENYIYPPPFGGSMQTDTSLRLDLDMDLDLWGRNRAQHQAALSRQLASSADLQVARNALVDATVQSYFNLQNALAQQSVITDIVSKLQNVVKITRQRVTAGLDTTVEVNQAASALSSARVELGQAVNNVELLRNQLSALVGKGPQRGNSIRQVALAKDPVAIPTELPMDLLGRRPDIVAARQRVLAAGSEISAAKADFYPNVNLSAFAGFMSLGLSNLLQASSQVYGVGPAITLPVFHGGALNARLDQRRAERDLAIADYNEAVLSAVRETADAMASIRSIQKQQADQAASLRAITSAYDIAVDRYRSGLGNFLQVLLAQNEVHKQALLATDMRTRAYKLDARLATALGGGYHENVTTH